MPDTADTASDDPTDDSGAQDLQNPNDLSTEMSQEEEQAFVNKTLGIPSAKSEEKPEVKDTEDKPKEDDKPVDEPTAEEEPEPPAVDSDNTEELDNKPTEIGEPQTDDLWVEVQDSEGKSVKLIYDPANPSNFLPDDFSFKGDKQLFEILDAKAEMASLYKERLGEVEKAKEEATTKENTAKTQADMQSGWDEEIQDLIDSKLLDAPKVKSDDKNFLQDPAVQKIDAVFKFMAKENTTRKAEGKPLLRSFGTAFNILNSKDTAKAENDKTKKENEVAKARGSLVGGTSAPSAGDSPLYKRGSASNIWQVKIPE